MPLYSRCTIGFKNTPMPPLIKPNISLLFCSRLKIAMREQRKPDNAEVSEADSKNMLKNTDLLVDWSSGYSNTKCATRTDANPTIPR